MADQFPEHVLTKWLGNTPKIAKEHYLQVTDEHWRRAVTGETKHNKNVAESTAVPSGLGMNRPAQRFRRESVTVERAMRNTHLHKQVGATRWARQDSNLTTENHAGDIENEENEQSSLGGVSKSASLIDKSEQMLQLLALLQGLSSDEIELLLRLADKLKQPNA